MNTCSVQVPQTLRGTTQPESFEIIIHFNSKHFSKYSKTLYRVALYSGQEGNKNSDILTQHIKKINQTLKAKKKKSVFLIEAAAWGVAVYHHHQV